MVRVVPKGVPKCGIEGGIETHIPILFIYNHIFCCYCYLHIIKDLTILCN